MDSAPQGDGKTQRKRGLLGLGPGFKEHHLEYILRAGLPSSQEWSVEEVCTSLYQAGGKNHSYFQVARTRGVCVAIAGERTGERTESRKGLCPILEGPFCVPLLGIWTLFCRWRSAIKVFKTNRQHDLNLYFINHNG